MADQLLIARLQLDPAGEIDASDADKLAALASLDSEETSWDYLVKAWRRSKAEEQSLKRVSSHFEKTIQEFMLITSASIRHSQVLWQLGRQS